MASTKEYLQFVLDQLSGLEEISYRAMMGVSCGLVQGDVERTAGNEEKSEIIFRSKYERPAP